MKCHKCGVSNEADVTFCSECGAKLAKEEHREFIAPARQAEKIGKEMGREAEKIGKEVGKKAEEIGKQVGARAGILLGRLTRGEKVVGAGALAALISFFVPWFSLAGYLAENLNIPEKISGLVFGGWAWLLPALTLASLALLYFSIGASAKTKAKRSSYYLLVGAVFATTAIVAKVVVGQIERWVSEATIIGKPLTVEFGWWLLVLGSLTIIVGAFLVQRENLKE
jgi:hypothetical protein